MDSFLWPLVRALGKPATVAVVAVGISLLTLLTQLLLTDNRRLLEARRRAALLTRQARSLPADSPRRREFLRRAAAVNNRLLLAGLVPLGLLLGPLLLPFGWFERIVAAVAKLGGALRG